MPEPLFPYQKTVDHNSYMRLFMEDEVSKTMEKIKKHNKSKEEGEEGRDKKKDKNCKLEEMR